MFVRSAALKELVTLRACFLDLGVLNEATGVQVKVDVVEVMEVFAACRKSVMIIMMCQIFSFIFCYTHTCSQLMQCNALSWRTLYYNQRLIEPRKRREGMQQS